MKSSERIVVNTGILYVKLIITIVVNLLSTRLILLSMGVKDYGIVNLISGIVAMLSFVQNSMTISTQRYLSVNMGQNNPEKQKRIFNTSILLHLILVCLIITILEACHPMVFNSQVQIPGDRLFASQVLYQLMIIGTALVVITVPYDATLNAHENMLWFSIASIIESLIRLAGACILLSYSHDKLIFYGLLIVAIRLVSMIIKVTYCRLHYPDSRISFKHTEKTLMREMFSFSFWNLFGSFATAARSQGMAVILNIFNGVAINAAYGIAHQISGQLSNFSATISKAMAPQIMQSKGASEKDRMINLSLRQSKYTVTLLTMFALPLLLDMEFILRIWLKEVPDYTVDFCSLIVLVALVAQLSSGLMTLIQANGRISLYQITMSSLILLSIPLAYYALKYDYYPSVVILILLIIEVFCFAVRLLFAKKLVGVKFSTVWRELGKPISFMIIIGVCLFYVVTNYLPHPFSNEWVTFLLHFFVTEFIMVVIIMTVIFSREERIILRNLVVSLKKRTNKDR